MYPGAHQTSLWQAHAVLWLQMALRHPEGPGVLRAFDRTFQFELVDGEAFYVEVQGGSLQVSAASQGQEAAAVFYLDQYLPVYYEFAASVQVQKPTGGWKANAYIIFDYQSPTDFKFAGIDVSVNKLVVGHRTASDWVVDAQSSVQGGVKSDTFYQMLVAVNGTIVTVAINGQTAFTWNFPPRAGTTAPRRRATSAGSSWTWACPTGCGPTRTWSWRRRCGPRRPAASCSTSTPPTTTSSRPWTCRASG